MNLCNEFEGHTSFIYRISWSPNGQVIASASSDGTARLWDMKSGKCLRIIEENLGHISCVDWSPKGDLIALGFRDRSVIKIFNSDSGKLFKNIFVQTGILLDLKWSPDGKALASASSDHSICIWNVESGELKTLLDGHRDGINSIAWIDRKTIASGSSDRTIRIWNAASGMCQKELHGHSDIIFAISWSPECEKLASASNDGTIGIWDIESLQLRKLEGHKHSVENVSFSSDGKLLASKSFDGTVKLWRCDNWENVATLDEPTTVYHLWSLAFHPCKHILATLSKGDRVIRIWDLNLDFILKKEPTVESVHYISAKIVLVGESNVGKSCLAMRLAEDSYPNEKERCTTHGMRFWPMQPEHLSPEAAAPKGERRDIVLWDMGGQEEYQLVHQLFLHDTTLALVLFDPTRGRTAFDEVEAWNKRLEKQLRGYKAVKFLVGSKMDETNALIDRKSIDRLLEICGFANYFETSALNGRGISELREAIANALDWNSLAKTNRPELFQRIRDEIERRRKGSEVVLHLQDLVHSIQNQAPDLYEENAVKVVAEQLSAQGIIAETHLASGELVLILQICEIERYAGSLIIAARDNPRGVPAIEMSSLAQLDIALPKIVKEERLPRVEELVVLECVGQLLIEHGICFEHEGLIVFPTLFRPTEREFKFAIQQSVSLYYDFSGAIDNIYASLVAWIVISKEFGRVRLWQDQAEFEKPGEGICGIRKIERSRGFAHMELYFQEETPIPLKEKFICFVEEHLHRHGVDLIEHVAITCACGYRFEEVLIRERIFKGDIDIGCPKCDQRNRLTEGAVKAREREPELAQKTWALRTEIEKKCRRTVDKVVRVFVTPSERSYDEPIRLLHLSDLHFNEGMDPLVSLQPLVDDIKDRAGGLGYDRLDYLVISGDLTMEATPKEFEVARQFVSGLIDEFGLTAERCIIVPGNHDLSWDETVYNWKPKRIVDIEKVPNTHYCLQGDGYLIRDEKYYPNRFENFSHDFYHPLVQKDYPLAFDHQCLSILFEQTGIQFITLNSSWQIDEYFQKRSGIHPSALARGLKQANEDISKAKNEGILTKDGSVLRIGVWHHPVTGNEKIVDDAFVEQLRKVGVSLCLHGHVHEDRIDLIGYQDPRKVYVAGAGSFGALAEDRPESIPRLYNLLEIGRNLKSIRVNTRCKPKSGGEWKGWNNWPTPDNQSGGLPFYDITLR